MTLQQLKYVIAVAEAGSISEAAAGLFISQPSLSNAIKELESEIGMNIFARTNRGIVISSEGEEFLGYARQVVQQAELLEDKYINTGNSKQRFSVSTQHYAFTANAFVDLIKEFGSDEYDFALRETKTYEIIEDVKMLKSEIGVLYLSSFNETVISKLIKDSNLVFTELFTVKPHVFVKRENPLAGEKSVKLKDFEGVPYVSFDQGSQNSFYFSEEVLSTMDHKKSIRVTDRAAVINLVIGLDAYTIATGVYPEYLHDDDIVAVPLSDVDEKMRVGYLTHKDTILSELGNIYISALQRVAQTVSLHK